MSALWTADNLLRATQGVANIPFTATGVSIDTRTLRHGDLFVALTGDRDGHDFVADALARGAAGALVHRNQSGPMLRVADTMTGLHDLGRFARARFRGRVAAVTGSVGKTTTKEMLRAILSPQGATHAAEASYNNHWGVPLTLARMPEGDAFAVIEIGMNHAGEIAPLSRLARPHVALITAVERAHVGHMGGIEGIADEKASIAAGLEPDGVAVLPADTPLLARLRGRVGGKTARVLTFGSAAGSDAHLAGMEADADGTVVSASVLGIPLRFRVGAPGRHMAMNAIGALLTAAALGADPRAGAEALAAFRPVAGRGARREIALPGGGRALLLDESYNASSASVSAALSVLRLQPAARRIAVLGDMLELGEEGPAEHRGLADAVADAADLLFTCGPLMGLLHDAVPARIRGAHAPDSETLAPLVASALCDGDAVLVKGSLGSRMSRVVSFIERQAGHT